ncbi:MAG: integrin alpha [Phycisphaerae bacterium]|jgi:hypothetical protein
MPWTTVVADPPLTNASIFTAQLPLDVAPCEDNDYDGDPDGCEVTNRWFVWGSDTACPLVPVPLPGTTVACTPSWVVVAGMPPISAWTGFYGRATVGSPRSHSVGGVTLPPTSVGARVLGQSVDDRFGTTVASDGRWLYIASPQRTALREDVPSLDADRVAAGVVYQLRTDVRVGNGPNRAQLWVEPGTREIPGEDENDPPEIVRLTYPNVDTEIPSRTDYTMPVPHQYIIETIGSIRGNYGDPELFEFDGNDCVEGSSASVLDASRITGYTPYVTGTAGYYMDRTPQIVGPHSDATISYVRALGDVDGDGIRDFAVGSTNVRQTVVTPGAPGEPATVTFSGQAVGSIFIVYGRGQGLEGDYLLENLAKSPSDPSRLKGVMLQGTSAGQNLARVFDSAGDFNHDGYDDVIVGSPDGNAVTGGYTGEVVIIFGSQFLESPSGGWTVAEMLSDANAEAVRFVGEAADDMAGANVAGVGDVDGDGYGDVLIAAPGAEGGKGAVYLIYGSADLVGEQELAEVGTVDLPGVKFVGRVAGDRAGGGSKTFAGTYPSDPGYSFAAYSRGVAALGDIDGDGNDDYAISAMLADPSGRVDSGEVYILYGRGDND